MASIFQNAVDFLGTTLKQSLAVENLRDYTHASKLFVGGGSYRLAPKHNFLFHVFIDLNENLQSQIGGRNTEIEIGLMAKNADLPKYTFDLKKYNAYNRVNYVQSKVSYEDVTIVFHDDSSNVVRNFYYDYFRYYYRDSDHGSWNNLSAYDIPNKYDERTIGGFGFTRRKDSSENFIKCIRLYSLHQKRFSEYILVNPHIKSFRHGSHANTGESGTLEHSMTISYETVIYNQGTLGQVNPTGFAELYYYDNDPSPLNSKGSVKSIFGAGGLLDAAGSVWSDFQNNNIGLGTIFTAARAINTARSMNLKNTLVSEVTGIYTQAASQAILGVVPSIDQAIRGALNSNNPNGFNVPTVAGIDGAVAQKNTGIQDLSSVAVLAGAAVLLNSTPLTNNYKQDPVVQSNNNTSSRYNPQFPTVPGSSIPSVVDNTFHIANDSNSLNNPSNQGLVNKSLQLIDVENNIARLSGLLTTLGTEAAQAQAQITTTQTNIADLNTRIASALALTPPLIPPAGFDLTQWTNDRNLLVSNLRQELQVMTNLNQLATQTYNLKVDEINRTKGDIEKYQLERNNLAK